MRKLVVNKCYGGFGLSDAAMHRYAQRKEMKLYPEECRFGLVTYWTVPAEKRAGILSTEEFAKAPLEDRRKSNEQHSSMSIYDKDIPRDDSDLVSVVEEMGEEASGPFAALEITEIPDDVDWVVEEYDGMEWISEAHRTW